MKAVYAHIAANTSRMHTEQKAAAATMSFHGRLNRVSFMITKVVKKVKTTQKENIKKIKSGMILNIAREKLILQS